MTITIIPNPDPTGEKTNIWREIVADAVAAAASNIYDAYADTAGTIFIVGADGKLAKSIDAGVTWALEDSSFGASDIKSVYKYSTLWYAGGADGKVADYVGDSVWTQIPTNFGTDTVEVVLGPLQYDYSIAAGGGNGRLETSSNLGVSWTTKVTNFGTSAVLDLLSNSFFELNVAVGEDGKIATASNGDYTLRANTFGASHVNAIARIDGTMVAVGNDGKIERSSGSGTTWTPATVNPFGISNINDIVSTGSQFIAVGDDGTMAKSPDGDIWALVADSSFGTTNINAIAYDSLNTTAIAVGDEGKVATATGFFTDWTQRVSGF